jgi:hypothetical protein
MQEGFYSVSLEDLLTGGNLTELAKSFGKEETTKSKVPRRLTRFVLYFQNRYTDASASSLSVNSHNFRASSIFSFSLALFPLTPTGV